MGRAQFVRLLAHERATDVRGEDFRNPGAIHPHVRGADLTDLTYTDANNFGYVIAGYGATQTFGFVRLPNVLTTSGTVKIYVSDSHITSGDFSGATEIPSNPAQSAPVGSGLVFEATGGSATGRYLYLVPIAGGATIGDLDARGKKVPFAVLQAIAFNVAWQEAVLRGPVQVTPFGVAAACYDGAIEAMANWAAFNAYALELLYGATVTDETTYFLLTPT